MLHASYRDGVKFCSKCQIYLFSEKVLCPCCNTNCDINRRENCRPSLTKHTSQRIYGINQRQRIDMNELSNCQHPNVNYSRIVIHDMIKNEEQDRVNIQTKVSLI